MSHFSSTSQLPSTPKLSKKPNDVIVISGNDIDHLSPIVVAGVGGYEEVTGFKIILKPRLPHDVCNGIRISTKEAMKIILASMRGKEFEVTKALKWHYVGREAKGDRTTRKTYTNEDQILNKIVEGIDNE
jgi:hypothetical protein